MRLKSAKAKGKSAKVQTYQPKQRGNQPKCKYISQSREEISQTANITAKAKGKLAKVQTYQPKQRENQPNSKYISQSKGEISQTANISANTQTRNQTATLPKPQSPNKTPIIFFSNKTSAAFGLLASSPIPSSQSATAFSRSPFT